jgi:predicted anti-sigma-YlaC factor YlaD
MTTFSGHLTDAMAQRLLDGRLEPVTDAGAEDHAQGCAECAALVESYRVLGEALDDLDVPALPADFTASVLERIDLVEARATRERRLALAVLAGVLLLAGGALVASGAGGLAATVGGWADGLAEATRALRIGRGVVPGLLSALRLPLLVGAAAVTIPLLFGLARLMPAPRTQSI